jgi:hypothetical protein
MQPLAKTTQAAGNAGKETRWVTVETGKNIPLEVGQCIAQPDYKDTLERRNVLTTMDVVSSKETKTYQEVAVGTKGRGLFKRTIWEPVAGTEKYGTKVKTETWNFDHTYDDDSSRRYAKGLVDDLCVAERDRMIKKMLEARTNLPSK